MKFQKILVAIDDSPLCPAVFAAALELAQSNKAALMLLQCLSPGMVSESMPTTAFDAALPVGSLNTDYQAYQTQQILLETQMEEAQIVLKRYCDEAISHGVPTESNYEVGEAGHQLCKVAKDWGADLIVVGRRGLTGLTEALVGSVSNYVVHHAPCSVLIIQEVEPQPTTTPPTDLSSVVLNPVPGQEPG
jgi:nucleotide-binding universal stress UspA family protein